MASGDEIRLSDIDARMLLTELTADEFIAKLQTDRRWGGVMFLKNYYTNISSKATKTVDVKGRLVPADTTGRIQAKSSYDTYDWVYSTIKHGIKHEFEEMEMNDLKQSGAMLKIFNEIRNNAVNWFYELIGKYIQALATGSVNYFDENGNFLYSEDVRVADGESVVVPGGRTSGLWYQNTDGGATTTREDVAPNYDTAPISQGVFIGGHKAMHKHRRPSTSGEGEHYLTHNRHYVLVHPDSEYDIKTLLDPNMYVDTTYADIKPLLGKYEIIIVQFPNPKFWMQATDAHTVGIIAFTGVTADGRTIFPTIGAADVNKETGATTFRETAQVGIGAKTPTGIFIHNNS